MYKEKLTEEDALKEITRLLNEPDLGANNEKLADLGLCYHVIGDTINAEKYYWLSYELEPNIYAASNLARMYIKLEEVDKLEQAYYRFESDDINIVPSPGLKLFAKRNKNEIIKYLADRNWGTHTSYSKYLYRCGEYEYAIKYIEEHFHFDHVYLNDATQQALLFWLRSKIALEKHDDIDIMLDSMSLNGQKAACKAILQVAKEIDNSERFIPFFEELLIKQQAKEVVLALIFLYERAGETEKMTRLVEGNMLKQAENINTNFNSLAHSLHKLERFDDLSFLTYAYKNFKHAMESVINKDKES